MGLIVIHHHHYHFIGIRPQVTIKQRKDTSQKRRTQTHTYMHIIYDAIKAVLCGENYGGIGLEKGHEGA